jgi:hypothetical protein
MLKSIILVLAASAAAVAGAQTSPTDETPIVVTGVRLDDARKRLEDCLARNCPPLEDMAATLQYAEALFVAGDYRKASSILQRSLGRNRDESGRYPNAVAGVYRALARVSIHEGDGERYRSASYGAVRSLKDGLPDDDPRVLGGILETAEMHASLGEVGSASRQYKSVAAKAREIGRQDLAAMADLRLALFNHRQGLGSGRRQMEAIAESQDPRIRIQRLAARIMLARIDRERGDMASSDRLVAQLAAMGLRKPTLIYAPPIAVKETGKVARGAAFGGIGGSSSGAEGVPVRTEPMMEPNEGFDYWADVGFWIGPDGRVDEVEVLRSKGPTQWMEPVVRSISGRVYATSGEASEASYRVERFTYTSLFETRTGTRIQSHSAQGRIESMDISPDESAAPPPPAKPQRR